jgi:GT2 family glycosyltransferase
MLVRTEVFARLGQLDEGLLSSPEHIDLCLSVREAGGRVYFEPSSMVSYLSPPPFRWGDIPFYLTRWSDEWNRASLSHFRRKWNLCDDDRFLKNHYAWLTAHRWVALKPFRSIARHFFGWRWGLWTEGILEKALRG